MREDIKHKCAQLWRNIREKHVLFRDKESTLLFTCGLCKLWPDKYLALTGRFSTEKPRETAGTLTSAELVFHASGEVVVNSCPVTDADCPIVIAALDAFLRAIASETPKHTYCFGKALTSDQLRWFAIAPHRGYRFAGESSDEDSLVGRHPVPR